MEKENPNYIPCNDCSLKGKTGLVLVNESYNCSLGYNDCHNVQISNNLLNSGRKISGFSDLEKESTKNKGNPFLDKEITPPVNSYNRQEPFFPTGRNPEKRLRLFPEK